MISQLHDRGTLEDYRAYFYAYGQIGVFPSETSSQPVIPADRAVEYLEQHYG